MTDDHGSLLLGIDVGTTLCKAGLITPDGRTVGQGHVPTPWRPVPTGADIDLMELFEAVLEAARRAIAAAPTGRVVGIGITSLAETGALLDASGRPLAPGLAWFDSRGEAEEAALVRAIGRPAFARHTGLSALRVTTLVKLRWLVENGLSPERACHWLSAAEWIAYCLGGEPVAELSLAARTGLFDQQAQDWWPDATDWLGMPPGVMPRLVLAGAPIGRVRPGLLPHADGAVLTIGGHDHLCAAVGAGARLNDVLNSCGTASALVRSVIGPLDGAVMERLVGAGIAVGAHVLEGQQVLLTGFLQGFALRRFLRLLGIDETERAALDASAAVAETGPLRADCTDGALATLTGIDDEVTPARVWRAALDSVERRLADQLELMRSEAGPHRRLIIVGGWARSPAVRAAKRQLLGPCLYAQVDEAGVHGAALMAGVAAGEFASPDDWPPVRLTAE